MYKTGIVELEKERHLLNIKVIKKPFLGEKHTHNVWDIKKFNNIYMLIFWTFTHPVSALCLV